MIQQNNYCYPYFYGDCPKNEGDPFSDHFVATLVSVVN